MRLSFSQISKYQQCPRRWAYQYRDKLSGSPLVASEKMDTGKHFANIMEQALLDPNPAMRKVLAQTQAVMVEPDTMSTRVRVCIEQVPEHIWLLDNPVSEDPIEWTFRCTEEDGTLVVNRGQEFTIVGFPDAWALIREHGKPVGVCIYEFKTCGEYASGTQRKLQYYEEWSPQPFYYAVMLRETYSYMHDLPLYRQHVVVSSRGHTAVGEMLRISDIQYARKKEEIINAALQVGREDGRHYSPLCSWCNYNNFCFVFNSGGDPDFLWDKQEQEETV